MVPSFVSWQSQSFEKMVRIGRNSDLFRMQFKCLQVVLVMPKARPKGSFENSLPVHDRYRCNTIIGCARTQPASWRSVLRHSSFADVWILFRVRVNYKLCWVLIGRSSAPKNGPQLPFDWSSDLVEEPRCHKIKQIVLWE